jgi:hypothetical protein
LVDKRLTPDDVEVLVQTRASRRGGSKPRVLVLEVEQNRGPNVVVFTDDGYTGYAYHFSSDRVAAHAWLYNLPGWIESRTWGDDQPPNPPPLSRRGRYLPRLSADAEPRVEFGTTIDVYFDDLLVARFDGKPDAPGMSLLAAKDGPLARVLR